jgi:micrococcal nuclease
VIAPTQAYVYNARVLRVVDGDTFDANVDLGFRLRSVVRFRLLGVDCPERKTPTRDAGEMAKSFTRSYIDGADVLIRTEKADVFGRYLARVWVNGIDLVEAIIMAGHGRPRP